MLRKTSQLEAWRRRIGKPVPASLAAPHDVYELRDKRVPLYVQIALPGFALVTFSLAGAASIEWARRTQNNDDTALAVVGYIMAGLSFLLVLINLIALIRWRWMWLTTRLLPGQKYGEDLEDFQVGILAHEAQGVQTRVMKSSRAIHDEVEAAFTDIDRSRSQ